MYICFKLIVSSQPSTTTCLFQSCSTKKICDKGMFPSDNNTMKKFLKDLCDNHLSVLNTDVITVDKKVKRL